MSAEENKALVRRWFEEFWNKKNLAAIDEFVSPNCVLYHASLEIRGIEDFNKQYVSPALSAFPDLQATIEDLVAEGDKIACRWTAYGTHKGEYMGIAPTGKKVTWTGIFISRISEGKFLETWQDTDALGLMQQLGAVPPLGED